MSYYTPRLIGGSLDVGAIAKTGLAIFFAILLTLGCLGLAVGYVLFGGDVYESIKRATVYLMVDGEVQGSGVIISPDGYMLTAAHVVKSGEAGEIMAVLYSGTKKAEKVRAVPTEHIGKPGKPSPEEIGKDYALLKLEAKPPLPYLHVIGSEDKKEGTKVFLAGFPMGGMLQTSIYGPNPRIEPGHITTVMRGGEGGAVAFATDARTVPGMSGGPCTTDTGDVIGVISMGNETAASYLILPTSRFKHVWEPIAKKRG